MADSFKKASRIEWEGATGQHPTIEQLNLGCLQRIADAAEKMAQNWSALTEERDRYKRWYEEERQKSKKLRHRIRALKGVATKLKQH